MSGRPSPSRRRFIDGVRWRVRTGAPWRNLPSEYGPRQTVQGLPSPAACWCLVAGPDRAASRVDATGSSTRLPSATAPGRPSTATPFAGGSPCGPTSRLTDRVEALPRRPEPLRPRERPALPSPLARKIDFFTVHRCRIRLLRTTPRARDRR
ncbi:transposase [Streptomyces sp. NPDC005752]|uniref:transposase n=1 Tax=Streptomyces sp. NPDC005752 TaxID=3157065 RepID=UPI0033EDF588